MYSAGTAHRKLGFDEARFLRQALEQNLTSSQSRAHFLRHVIGRPQAAQGLAGRNCFCLCVGGSWETVRGVARRGCVIGHDHGRVALIGLHAESVVVGVMQTPMTGVNR